LTTGKNYSSLNKENWLTPTQLGTIFNVSSQKIGRVLKAENLHGDFDSERKYSVGYYIDSKICHYSNKRKIAYKYDPDFIIQALSKFIAKDSDIKEPSQKPEVQTSRKDPEFIQGVLF
jgi:hypothetical protein